MVLHQYYTGIPVQYTVLLSRSLKLKKMRSGAPSAGTEANCSVATHAQKFFISTATYRRLKIKYQSKSSEFYQLLPLCQSLPIILKWFFRGTDFNCSLCVYRKGNSSVLAVCRFIFTSLLSDRELDKLQHFSASADQTDDYRQLLRNPITYSKIRKRLADKASSQNSLTANQNGASLATHQITPYSQIEHFLADLVTFLFNIKKYSADRIVLDQSELAKHKISSLIRLTSPKALHYWMSSQMRPVSPLRNFVKRIAKPKQADSDSDEDSKSKRIKMENTNWENKNITWYRNDVIRSDEIWSELFIILKVLFSTISLPRKHEFNYLLMTRLLHLEIVTQFWESV